MYCNPEFELLISRLVLLLDLGLPGVPNGELRPSMGLKLELPGELNTNSLESLDVVRRF